MSIKVNIKKLFAVVFFSSFFLSSFVRAVEDITGLDAVAQTGLSAADPIIIVSNVIRIALGFLGIVAVVIIMYAGWTVLVGGETADQIDKAKTILKNAIIGLVLILSAFSIASFVLNRLSSATGGGDGGSSLSGGFSGGFGAALGVGAIESHYPARDAINIPRNTKIAIVFKEAIDLATIINDTNGDGKYGGCNSSGVCDKSIAESIAVYQADADTRSAVELHADVSSDNKKFVFTPIAYLGNALLDVKYTVALFNTIKNVNNDAVFPGAGSGYAWDFEVSTAIDNTPPRITGIMPLPDTINPRNVIVQIEFSEAMSPLSASGSSDSFNNIIAFNTESKSIIDGSFYLTNQFKTVEFLTNNVCGVNSCGASMYCFSANADIQILVKAANIALSGEPFAVYPYDGVVDMAGNSLDGNNDGTAQGPETQSGLSPFNADNNTEDNSQLGDDYVWSFSVNDQILSGAPTISEIYPDLQELNVNLKMPINAVFDRLMSAFSVSTDNISLGGSNALNYWVSQSNTGNGSSVLVWHDSFGLNQEYSVQFKSDLQDIYQNCYKPCSGLGVAGSPSCCNGVPSGSASCQ